MFAPTVDAVAEKYAGGADVTSSTSMTPRVSQRQHPDLDPFQERYEEERVVGATSKEAISRMLISTSPPARQRDEESRSALASVKELYTSNL